MNYPGNYLLYPFSRVLENAVAENRDFLNDEQSGMLFPDRSGTEADNFLHTRGNFEQQQYSTAVFAGLSEALKSSLTDEMRASAPLDWAEKQNHLGNLLAALAQQEDSAARYEEAIQCFTASLEELGQESVPALWAQAQYNLGTACLALGRLNSDQKALKTAVDAYTSALLVWSKTASPEQWMLSMHNLGVTFHEYGKLLTGTRTFQKSVVAFKNALSVLDADDYAFELAATHNNCGAVLHDLALSEENMGRMDEAIRSYEKAWTVCMEQQLPVHLSVMCRINKTLALGVVAEFNNDAVMAEEVADEFEIILECFPHALQPSCEKHCVERREEMLELANSSAA